MLGFLYSLGQVVCLPGLTRGAILAITASQTFIALRQARFEHHLQTRRARPHPTLEDPHVSSLALITRSLGTWRTRSPKWALMRGKP